MGRKHVRSRPGLFGTVYYYDEHGNPIGKSRPGLLEGTRVYTDENGRYAGKSRPGFFAKEVGYEFLHCGYAAGTAYEDYFVDVGVAEAGILHCLLARYLTCLNQVVCQLFELGACEALNEVFGHAANGCDVGQVDFGCCAA